MLQRIYNISLYVSAHQVSFGFGLLVGQNKQFEVITWGSGELWRTCSQLWKAFYRLNIKLHGNILCGGQGFNGFCLKLPYISFCFTISQTKRHNLWFCVTQTAHKETQGGKKRRRKKPTIKLLRGIFGRFLHLVLDVPWHALFTFGIGGKDFQIIQLKLYPSRDPVPFLSSAYWAAPTEKKHLTALTVNEANVLFALFIKAPFWRWSNWQQSAACISKFALLIWHYSYFGRLVVVIEYIFF